MLKTKQGELNQNFIDAYNNIESIVSEAELDEAISRRVQEMKPILKKHRYGLAWSGGKDSVVVEHLLKEVGYPFQSCIGMTPELEYPEFMKYVTDNMPPDFSVYMSKHTLKWLSENQKFLFPKNSNIASVWFKNVQHRAQDMFWNEKNLTLLVTGRRKKDRNYVGPNGIYRNNKTNVLRYSPIYDWSHELVLACIKYKQLPLAPFYHWPNGWIVGSCNFANRQWTGSTEAGWNEVWQIDQNCVIKASKLIKSAEDYVRNLGV